MTRLTDEEVDEAHRFAESYTRQARPRPPPPARAVRVRGCGPQGGRRRQRRYPLLHRAPRRDRRPRPAVPPDQGSPAIGARDLRRASAAQVPVPGPAGCRRPTRNAGGQRRVPGMGSRQRLRRLRAATPGHEVLGRQARPVATGWLGRLRPAVRRHPRREPTPAPASRPSSPATWAADRHSTRPCPTSRSPTPTRTSATTRPSGGPSSRAGSPPTSATDHAHRGCPKHGCVST